MIKLLEETINDDFVSIDAEFDKDSYKTMRDLALILGIDAPEAIRTSLGTLNYLIQKELVDYKIIDPTKEEMCLLTLDDLRNRCVNNDISFNFYRGVTTDLDKPAYDILTVIAERFSSESIAEALSDCLDIFTYLAKEKLNGKNIILYNLIKNHRIEITDFSDVTNIPESLN